MRFQSQQLTSDSQPPTKAPLPRRVLTSLTPHHENIYTLPNILTISRLVAAPLIGYLVLHDQHAWAVGLFAYAGITDLIDGHIARRWKLQTVVGTVIDPMADKTLMTILTVCLAVKGALPGRFEVRTEGGWSCSMWAWFTKLRQSGSLLSSWAAISFSVSLPFTTVTFPFLPPKLSLDIGIFHSRARRFTRRGFRK